MNRAVSHDRSVDSKGKQIPNDLQPWSARPGLRLRFATRVYKVQLRFIHMHPADQFAVRKGIPLNGEVHPPGGKEWDGNIAGGLVNPYVLNRVRSAPQVNTHGSDLSGIK